MEQKDLVKKPHPKIPLIKKNPPSQLLPQAPPKMMDYLNPTKNFSPISNINLTKANLQLNHPHLGSLHHPQFIQHPLLQYPLQNNKIYHPNLISETVHNDILHQNNNPNSNDNSREFDDLK